MSKNTYDLDEIKNFRIKVTDLNSEFRLDLSQQCSMICGRKKKLYFFMLKFYQIGKLFMNLPCW